MKDKGTWHSWVVKSKFKKSFVMIYHIIMAKHLRGKTFMVFALSHACMFCTLVALIPWHL